MNFLKERLEILYSDKYIIAVNKPPGFVVQGARYKEESLLERVKEHIKREEKKMGNVFLAVIHRLDKPVSGVCLFARRSKTANRLNEVIKEGRFTKIYLAKVEGEFKESEGLMVDYLAYENGKGRVVKKENEMALTKEAITFFKLLKKERNESLLLLSPITGRKHQLRIALAQRGHPIIGDFKYGSKRKLLRGTAILLHSLLICLPHPHLEISLEIFAPIPPYFQISSLDKTVLTEFANRIANNPLKHSEKPNL